MSKANQRFGGKRNARITHAEGIVSKIKNEPIVGSASSLSGADPRPQARKKFEIFVA